MKHNAGYNHSKVAFRCAHVNAGYPLLSRLDSIREKNGSYTPVPSSEQRMTSLRTILNPMSVKPPHLSPPAVKSLLFWRTAPKIQISMEAAMEMCTFPIFCRHY